MSSEDFRHVLGPKLVGTYNLHEVFENQQLDFFLILSSYAGLIGNIGQANYAAASTFQDAFARWRTAQGMPTRSLDIGVVQGAGHTHENPDVVAHLQRLGLHSIELEAFFALIAYAICNPAKSSTASQVAMGWGPPKDWSQAKYESLDRRFSHLIPQIQSAVDQTDKKQTLNAGSQLEEALAGGKSKEDIAATICNSASEQIVSILGIAFEDVDPSMSIAAHGGDSLVAVEFRNWFRKTLNCSFSMDQISNRYSLKDLSSIAAEQVVRGKA